MVILLFDTVIEFDADDEFWQLVLPRSLSQIFSASCTCPAKVPGTYLIYAAMFSNASGLLPPSVECLHRGL